MGNVNMEAKQIHDRTEAGKHQSLADHLAALDAVAKKIDDMPTYTSVDRAFLDEWESKLPDLENDVSDLETLKANQITIAPFFSAEASYDPGDLVYYNGLTYRCVNAHEGEWDADDFAATTISNELDALKSGLTNLNNLNNLNLIFSGTDMQDYLKNVIDHVNSNYDVGLTINAISVWDYNCTFLLQASRATSSITIVLAIPEPGNAAVNKTWICMKANNAYTYSTIDMTVVS